MPESLPHAAPPVAVWNNSGRQSRARLICFPYAGGGIAGFKKWADLVPKHIEVCAPQLPGRESQIRATPFTTIWPLVETLSTALLPLLDRPFVFFGHSMGGLIAFALAEALGRGGRKPAKLLISACRAPGRPRREPPMHALPESELIAELRARYNSVPDALMADPELRALLLPGLRGDIQLVETFQYSGSAAFDFPISVFGGIRDTSVTRDDLEAWREQTTGPFRLHMLAGDHFFLNSHRDELLRIVAVELAEVVPQSAFSGI